jgi:hypothetical protein
MPLPTELVIFWLMSYKDAAPTALKFPMRLRNKEAGQKFAAGIMFKCEKKLVAKFADSLLLGGFKR